MHENVLQDNARISLPISGNGSYRFPTKLTNGSGYAVSITSRPVNPDQDCSISNNTGIIAGSNSSNVNVTCTADFYTVGEQINDGPPPPAWLLSIRGYAFSNLASPCQRRPAPTCRMPMRKPANS